jgi:membrane-bound serine protease (ClpP class)
MAQQKQRGWSLMMAMVDQNLRVQRFTQQGTGAARYFAPAELAEQADADQWQAGGELPIRGGLRSAEVMETGLAVMQVADFGELRAAYQLEGTLPGVRPNWAHRLIEFLASPKVAGALLFIGWFALMFEFMSPGLGLPGFLAGLCFLLFFWSAVLHGTAGWLEILLFAAGVVCLALEIFVLPGLGAFGIGGTALIVASIVLASQTFVVPRNAYEWSQVPNSLLLVSAAGAGIIASLICMPRLLTHAPLFRRIALETPDEIQTENIRYLESLVHLDYLLGKRGLTTTPLTPSGKARFGDEVVDVVSDGDLVPAGSDVTVAEVRGSEVVVRTIS